MTVHVVTSRWSELGFMHAPSLLHEAASTPAAVATITAVCAVIAAALIMRSKRPRPDAPLAPGALPVLGHTITVLKNYHRFQDMLLDMARAVGLGRPYRLSLPGGQSYLVLSSPAAVQHVLRTNFDNYVKGPEFSSRMQDLLGGGIFNVDGCPWRQQRKLSASIFNVRSFRDWCSSVFRDKLLRLYARLDRAAEQGEVVDMQDLLFRFTLDSFCSIGFGMDPGCLATDGPVDFATAFDRSQAYAHLRFVAPLWRLMDLVTPQGWVMRSDVRAVRQFARKVVAARRSSAQAPDTGGADLLSLFTAMRDEASGQPLSDELLVDYVLNFIIAGRDTTANALAWTLHELSQHPGEEQALLQEVARVMTAAASATPAKAGSDSATTTHTTADAARDTSSQQDQTQGHSQTQNHTQDQSQEQQAEPASSSLPSSLPSYDDIRAMRFSRAVLLEALRLHPSVPKQVKFAVADDVLPDSGTRVPGGSAIMYSSYVMGRSETIWGPDAGQFRPSRWLSGEPGSLPSAFEYPVFNAGPRICLGKGLAELEGVYVLVGLLKRYRLEVVAGQRVEYMTTVTLPMKEGLKVKVTRRAQRRGVERCGGGV